MTELGVVFLAEGPDLMQLPWGVFLYSISPHKVAEVLDLLREESAFRQLECHFLPFTSCEHQVDVTKIFGFGLAKHHYIIDINGTEGTHIANNMSAHKLLEDIG